MGDYGVSNVGVFTFQCTCCKQKFKRRTRRTQKTYKSFCTHADRFVRTRRVRLPK